MKDNIKPEHYRTGEIDLYEAFSQIFPHNEYRAGMQMIAMRYMFRDKIDRVEDLGKSIYTLERLKEKEIERAGETEIISTKDGDIVLKSDKDSKSVYFLKCLLEQGYKYIARDKDDCLWVYGIAPTKGCDVWASCPEDKSEKISNYSFIEAQWTDNEPTKIADLLATYENGGENGKVEQAPHYCAKIKGWEILDGDSNWVYLKNSKEFILGEVTFHGAEIDVMTKEEWNDLGINDTNADFEEVEVWEVDLSETYKNGGESGK